MKDLIIAVVLLMALIINFSFCGYSPMEILNGSGTHQKGDSGFVIPGKGEALANTIIEPESIPERSEDEPSEDERTKEEEVVSKAEITNEATNEVTSEETNEEIKEEHNKVDNMFWHGVAAVLIGQLSVPLVTFLLKKIRGGKDATD